MEIDPGLIYAFASDLLKEDLGRGDLTTQSVVRGGARGRGRFIAGQDFVLCGLEVAEAVFGTLDNNIQVESRFYDADRIASGEEFARIEGSAAVLLTGERTALNVLQRMSAVATVTRRFVDCIDNPRVKVVDTRKTTPGLRMLERYAVSVGGGYNGRFGLDDGMLIKENHIAFAGGVKRAVELARTGASQFLKVAIEARSGLLARDAVDAGADIVLLVFTTLQEVSESVRLIREKSEAVSIGVSCGLQAEQDLRSLARCDIDFVSVGALTQSAVPVDITFKTAPI
jgi:nicotinate-nucleotide pyrophosphorylase (carboxylating)